MLLLLIDSLLLLFITLSLGIFTRAMLGRLFRSAIHTDILGTFLLGLMTSSLYFNVLSFWLPVNYYCLIPLLIASVGIVLTHKGAVRDIRRTIEEKGTFIFRPRHLFVTGCILVVLFAHWIIAPHNPDSLLYHYSAILWYETYKVVPGLANIHGRFAFNPVSFIIQAAYSFTGLTGQSLYPLNGVLAALFYMWLLIRLLRVIDRPVALVYGFVIFVLYRVFLINISSPSSDTLANVCVAYGVIRLLEILLSGNVDIPDITIPFLVLLYSVLAKLAAFPLLLVLPYVFFVLPAGKRKAGFLAGIAVVALLLYIPWLGRNYILSGYLVFPAPYADWFHPDWKAPPEVLRLEYAMIVTSRYPYPASLSYVESLHFKDWFPPWLLNGPRHNNYLDTGIFLVAFLSPVYWLFSSVRTAKKAFGLWLIVYAGLWMWLLTAPVHRFAAVLMASCAAIPFLASARFQKKWGLCKPAVSLLLLSCMLYHITRTYHKPGTYPFTLAECWLFPLKDIHYREKGTAGYAYKTMADGSKVYVEDTAHYCINTCLPCMNWDYGEIEKRGARIDQGFRLVHNDIRDRYPFMR